MKHRCGAGCELSDSTCYGIIVDVITEEIPGFEITEASLCEKHLKEFSD